MKKIFTSFLMSLMAIAAFAQGSVSGVALDGETKEGLIGASVLLEGTAKGNITEFDGSFVIADVTPGTYNLVISYVGYTTKTMEVVVTNQLLELGEIAIESDAIGLDAVNVVASAAVDRKTPVAVSTISGLEIETKLGNQEFPEILRSTPSVYVTKTGGGFGDARINVRGFNQSNVAVMINGIPVNDMENGWVYWSNWAGLSDVTRQMQVQRGLGASKLAINSVGGTINIVTKTTDMERGGKFFASMGNDGYRKVGATVSTGLLDNGWAFTFSGSRTVQDGYVDATWANAWSYFGSISKQLNDKHQLAFTIIGAPQRHGQRSFRENIRTYVPLEDSNGDGEFDKEDDAAYVKLIQDSKAGDFDDKESLGSIRYNSDWGYKDGNIYSMRENFYHKPQMALNHYWDISDKAFLATSVYYSTGRGGGSGDLGRIGGRGSWGFRDDNGTIRVDDIVRWNQGRSALDGIDPNTNTEFGYVAGERNGIIRRASMNEHNWYGALSTLKMDITPNLQLIAGVDLRGYRGIHYRRVLDLLGNDAWLVTQNVNVQPGDPNYEQIDTNGNGSTDWWESGYLVREDEGQFTIDDKDNKIAYDNDGIVGWQGFFAQLEYNTEKLSVFGAGSISNTSYAREDRFNYDVDGKEVTDRESDDYNQVRTENFNYFGYNAKAGANYNINDQHNIFVNGGYYSRAPMFDGVFPQFNNQDLNDDAVNETITAGEVGYGFRSTMVSAKVNGYYTSWQDRTEVRFNPTTEAFDNILGIDALHTGIEFELNVKPVSGLNLRAMASFGDWIWENDVEAIQFDINNQPVDTIEVFIKDMKVGDAAQTTLLFGASYAFKNGLAFDFDFFHFDNLYADFNPTDRVEEPAAGESNQALKLPAYQLLNVGVTYGFDWSKTNVRLRLNINNVLDELYIAEAFDAPSLVQSRGFFGFGRTWNVSAAFDF